MDMTRKCHRLLAVACCALLLNSCFAYHARFQKSVAAAAAAGPPKDATGPWIGRWVSDHNGHKGALWCIITPVQGKPNTYDFRYRAGWGILQFGNYVHTVDVKINAAGHLLVKGEMELPKFVGTYSLDGTVTATEFNAAYKSTTGDHGKMTLRRPPAPAAKKAE